MTVSATTFKANLNFLNAYELAAGTVKMALVTSSYTPDYTSGGHTAWASASGYEISAANGYSAGGKALVSMAVSAITGGYKLSSENVLWTASGGAIAAFRYAILYFSGTLGGITNPLIAGILGDTTPADIPATGAGNPLLINCPADGWIKITA